MCCLNYNPLKLSHSQIFQLLCRIFKSLLSFKQEIFLILVHKFNYVTKSISLFVLTPEFIYSVLAPPIKLPESFMQFNFINLAFHQQDIFLMGKKYWSSKIHETYTHSLGHINYFIIHIEK